ncbi:hypothetical protein K2173_025273 [Erythroxylum novogranatense]|uniref:Late embryogenesis abundant protein LEA-2 subgroup domain-containing protein n=1 Tax=Erythroxylum novogranatense TaxID=1862640 RepID=A0AAV8UG79_9ROSI|nr:hypothetical protein K2173_025273 [Erythroxylum novogranatense]
MEKPKEVLPKPPGYNSKMEKPIQVLQKPPGYNSKMEKPIQVLQKPPGYNSKTEKPIQVLQKTPGYKDPTNNSRQNPKLPPRKPILPTSYQPRKKRAGCCRICCCLSCILLIVIILAVLVASGFFYVWTDPKLPVFHVLSFNFPTFKVTKQPDGAYLNAATVTRVEVKNPNTNIRIRYGESNVHITIGKTEDIDMGTAQLPGFTQGTKNTTSLKIETRVTNELIEGAGLKLMDQFRRKNLVVNVEVKTKFGISVGGLETEMTDVQVLCEGMTLKEIEDSQLPKCHVKALRWLNLA